jgi:hypothetical protein
MPWLPELFSAPALAHVWEVEERERLRLVPFFPGLLTGEIRAVVGSFAGEPELHHPVRGRIKGAAAFERFADETTTWLADRNATVEDVGFVITPGRGVEETILRLDGDEGPIELPIAIATDHDERGRPVEQRMYFSTWPLTGVHTIRAPLLQPDPGLSAPDVVGDHLRARGGVTLEQCAITDDGRACALEYNVIASGRTALPPQAGLAVCVRGDGGRLAAARIYDDIDLPMTSAPDGLTEVSRR